MQSESPPSPLQRLIQDAIDRSGETRDHFDSLIRKKTGSSGKSLWDIHRGKSKRPQAGTLAAVSEVLGIPLHLLAAAAAGQDVGLPSSPDEPVTVALQKLDLSLSMGPGTLIDDWVEAEPVAFDRGFLQSITRAPAHRLKLVTGIGDSMYPTLNWGDAIMIDTTDTHLARQDGIYWISLYGAAGIKRLRTVGAGRVMVKSDNPTVDDQEVDAADLRIEGRAIWVARGL